MTFNKAQMRVIESDAAKIVVAAGPGSGKSTTLIERVARLVRDGVHGTGIWLVTFTQAGAQVMAKRLNENGITVGYVGTRHGLMYRLLNRYGDRIGYRDGGVTLLTEEQQMEMLVAITKEFGYKGSGKALSERRDETAELIWREHAHRLRRNNCVTYDSVLSEGLRLLPFCVKETTVDHLLCDECQDNSETDWRIDYAIPARSRFFCGDNDQAIFQWRGAHPAGFVEAAMDEETELHRLELNYRSGDTICHAATRLIRNNVVRVDKDVIAAERGDSHIYTTRFDSWLEECNQVAAQVRQQGGDECAVLLRSNHLVRQYRDALKAAGLPVLGGQKRELPADWQAALDVLNLWLDPRNDFIAERIIKRLTPSDLSGAKKRASQAGLWLSCEVKLPTANPTGQLDMIPGWLAQYQISREMQLLVQDRIALLPQTQPTLADLLHDLFNHDQWDKKYGDERGVHVGTVHSAKGREWRQVWLPAFEEGILPSLTKNADLEEERRLAFVALTRAKEAVWISYSATRRPQWGNPQPVTATPSRFLGELEMTL